VATVCLFWLGFRQGEVPVEEESETDLPTVEEQGETVIPNYLMIKQEWLKQSLLDYFLQEKPYLNPDLNLGDVSKALGTNKTYLSQLINREFEMNFYTFVNQYRIDYVFPFIKNNEKLTFIITHQYREAGYTARS
jgi:YesN/AraC family two-component response regulator